MKPLTVTVPFLWECSCDHNYVHHTEQPNCHICNSNQDEMPDAMANDARAFLGREIERIEAMLRSTPAQLFYVTCSLQMSIEQLEAMLRDTPEENPMDWTEGQNDQDYFQHSYQNDFRQDDRSYDPPEEVDIRITARATKITIASLTNAGDQWMRSEWGDTIVGIYQTRPTISIDRRYLDHTVQSAKSHDLKIEQAEPKKGKNHA